MARIRTVKPGLFTDDELFDMERETKLPLRLAFVGLWTQCDRDGRFPWRPRMLQVAVLPYDTGVDFAAVLKALAKGRWIVPYMVDGQMFGYVRTWAKHQQINNRELASEIPVPTPETIEAAHLQLDIKFDASLTRDSRVTGTPGTGEPREADAIRGEGKGREGKGRSNARTDNASPTRVDPATFAIALPLNDSSEYGIKPEEVAHWSGLYRAVDVESELRIMRGWLESNPTRRKTRNGILRFVTTWLAKEQNRGGTRGRVGGSDQQQPRGNTRDASEIAAQRRKARELNATQ